MRWRQFLTPVKGLESEEVKSFMSDRKEGSYTLLDVRQPAEYESSRIPGAKLVPLPELTDRMGEIDKEKPVVVYCAIGGRSRAASQLLAGGGFNEVYNLKGGIKAWQGASAAGPAERGMQKITGHETAGEIVLAAYGMEEGLRLFYSRISQMTEDPALVSMAGKLARIEEAHKEKVFKVYQGLDEASMDRESFEKKADSEMMEGGYSVEDFLNENMEYTRSSSDLLGLAMMLEAEALDLYMRYSEKIGDKKAKDIMHGLADDEKAHLSSLGSLMNETSKKV